MRSIIITLPLFLPLVTSTPFPHRLLSARALRLRIMRLTFLRYWNAFLLNSPFPLSTVVTPSNIQYKNPSGKYLCPSYRNFLRSPVPLEHPDYFLKIPPWMFFFKNAIRKLPALYCRKTRQKWIWWNRLRNRRRGIPLTTSKNTTRDDISIRVVHPNKQPIVRNAIP